MQADQHHTPSEWARHPHSGSGKAALTWGDDIAQAAALEVVPQLPLVAPDVVAAQMSGCMLHQEQEGKLHDLVQDLHPTSALVGEAAKADVQEVLPGRLESHFHRWTDVDDLATNPYPHHQLLCPVSSDPANWKQDYPHTATQVTQLPLCLWTGVALLPLHSAVLPALVICD